MNSPGFSVQSYRGRLLYDLNRGVLDVDVKGGQLHPFAGGQLSQNGLNLRPRDGPANVPNWMLALALEDSDFSRGLLFRLSEAHHEQPALALNLDVQHVPCINPGLSSGLRGDDHLTSIRDSGYHAKRLGQTILAVNPDHQFQALIRFARWAAEACEVWDALRAAA